MINDELNEMMEGYGVSVQEVTEFAPVLLKKTSTIWHKVEEREATKFNIFSAIHMGRREVDTHSYIIFSLLNEHESHAQGNKYLSLFLKQLHIDPDIIGQRWSVSRERIFQDGRIDFYLECKDYVAVIEMKIDAGDQPLQLERYDCFAKTRGKSYGIYYLTLDGKSPSEQSVGAANPEKIHLVSFKDEITNWLSDCLSDTESTNSMYSYILEYRKLVQSLTEVTLMKVEDAHILNTSQDLKHARILWALSLLRLSEIMFSFFDQCSDELNRRGYSFTRECRSTCDEYYLPQGKQKKEPAISHVIDEVAIGSKTKLKFILELHCEDRLYWGLYFVKDGIRSHDIYLTIAEANKANSAFIEKCKQRVSAALIPELKTTTYAVGWDYVTNLAGETFSFYDTSDSVLALADGMEDETKYACDQICQVIEKL